jgi:predicted DCC family thiol-disulfide oxidoreductase YuxK
MEPTVVDRETGTGEVACPLASEAGNEGPIVFFDGVCGLCNRAVDFIFTHDHSGVFRAAPLQGETAARCLEPRDTQRLGSLVLLTEEGVFRRSSAVVRILSRLGGGWRIAGGLLWLIPRPMRDLGYELVARNRYRVFGRKETCRLPKPDEVGRLLP